MRDTLVTRDGEVVHPRVREAHGLARPGGDERSDATTALDVTAADRWILRAVRGPGPADLPDAARREPRTLGRATRADFIVDAPLVSRVHCRLERVATTASSRSRTCDSTNGTFVNDRRVDTRGARRRATACAGTRWSWC